METTTMQFATQQAPAPLGPRHQYYVSLANGCIYPALSSPPGYEDTQPTDFRPAQPHEIQAYLNGQTQVNVEPIPLGVSPTAQQQFATPTTLKLADDDATDPAADAIAAAHAAAHAAAAQAAAQAAADQAALQAAAVAPVPVAPAPLTLAPAPVLPVAPAPVVAPVVTAVPPAE